MLPALLSVAALGGLVAARAPKPPADDANADVTPVVSCDGDGFVYEYHVPTGTDGLYDQAKDPGHRFNLIDGNQDRARALRRTLEKRLGVESLDDLRVRYADQIRRLHALGYL